MLSELESALNKYGVDVMIQPTPADPGALRVWCRDRRDGAEVVIGVPIWQRPALIKGLVLWRLDIWESVHG